MLRTAAVSERRRLLVKLVRELARVELISMDHAMRESRRIGPTPPVAALRAVADHAAAMRPRLVRALELHDVAVGKTKLGKTLASLCNLVADRTIDADRTYRIALFDLRHAVELVDLLRTVAHAEELFALVRWCDDWRSARGMLVARVELGLAWFAERARAEQTPMTSTLTFDDPEAAPDAQKPVHLRLV